ncbi:MAG: ribonuclease E/G, partial [Thiohalorhabdaceae bacterium]
MSGSEILVNVTPQEVRVAIVENGLLQEVHIERPRTRGIVGNIYKGKVGRVLPGMQAAFIDIGLDKAAFLHASDVLPPEGADIPSNGEEPPIADLLAEGDEVVVQVNKDPIGTKGARVSTQLTLPSRCLVYMPFIERVGVSRRIADPDERARLKAIMEAIHPPEEPGGFIVRTVSEGVSETEFERSEPAKLIAANTLQYSTYNFFERIR